MRKLTVAFASHLGEVSRRRSSRLKSDKNSLSPTDSSLGREPKRIATA